MPLSAEFKTLNDVLSKLQLETRRPFRDFDVLAVQHVQSSMTPLIDALRLGGAEAERITLVAKAYSATAGTVSALRSDGVNLIHVDHMTDPLRSYEDELRLLVADTVRRTRSRRLLVIDEGAVAIRALAASPTAGRVVRAVEQTTRGARWISRSRVPFPVVDVARSQAKATAEAPLVAQAMIRNLRTILPTLSIEPESVGLVGYGRLGGCLATALRPHFEVFVSDLDPAKVRTAQDAGLRTAPLSSILEQCGVVLGCTGHVTVTGAHLSALRRPTVLASGSSSDLEFELCGHRTKDSIIGHGDFGRPWENHYEITFGTSHTMLGGGFPLNFIGAEALTPEQFQMTRALMLAGADQVLSQNVPGIADLDAGIQRHILGSYGMMYPGLGVR